MTGAGTVSDRDEEVLDLIGETSEHGDSGAVLRTKPSLFFFFSFRLAAI